MPNSFLLDASGRPIQKPTLLQKVAQANVMGVRQAVGTGATRGLTPIRLANILREAEDGDPQSYFELAEEMEEKDLHYLSVLGTRKRAISGLDITLEAAGDQPEEIAAKDLIQEIIDNGVIDDYIFDMMDAVGKGFSVGEIMWDIRSDRWMPTYIEWVDPRFIDFDRATRRQKLLRLDNGQFSPLTPGKFIDFDLMAKSGIPIRGGLARAVAWGWMFKNFTVKDWVQFAEIYGMPIRIGKYPQGASDDDKTALLRAIAMIGADAAGIIPQSMAIELVKAEGSTNGHDLFSGLAEYLDKQVSKVVLGQTGTTDSTPGQLGSGEDHTEVRRDIEKADAKAVQTCLNRQFVRLVIDINFGPQKTYPYLYIGRPETKDAELMLKTAQVLVPMGARISASQILSAAGFSDPTQGETILQPPATPSPTAGAVSAALSRNSAQELLAMLTAETIPEDDSLSRAAREQSNNYEAVMQPAVDQILTVLATAKDGQDALEKLGQLSGTIDMTALADTLAKFDFQALAGGIEGKTI